jgi:hypothetical protein
MIAFSPAVDPGDKLEDAADMLAFLADATQAVDAANGCRGLSDRSARGFALILTAIERTLREIRG